MLSSVPWREFGERRVVDDDLELPGTVESAFVSEDTDRYALMEYRCATSKDSVRTHGPGEADSRIDVVIVGNVGLIFIPDTQQQGEYWCQNEIVLCKESQFELVGFKCRIAACLTIVDRSPGEKTIQ